MAGRDFTVRRPQGQAGTRHRQSGLCLAFFPNVDPLVNDSAQAHRSAWWTPMFEIIGVVSDAEYRSMREPMMPTVYQFSSEFDSFVLHVRTGGRPNR